MSEEFFALFNGLSEKQRSAEQDYQRQIDMLEGQNETLRYEKFELANKLRRLEELSNERCQLLAKLHEINGLDSSKKDSIITSQNKNTVGGTIDKEKLARKLARTHNQRILEPVRSSDTVGKNKTGTSFNASLDEFIPFSGNSDDKLDIVKRATKHAIRRSSVTNPCSSFQTGQCLDGDACRFSHDVVPLHYCAEYNDTGSCSNLALCNLRHELYEYCPGK